MDPTPLIVLIAALFLAAPILAIVALVRVSALQKREGDVPRLTARIYSLEQTVKALERKLQTYSEPPPVRPSPAAPVVVENIPQHAPSATPSMAATPPKSVPGTLVPEQRPAAPAPSQPNFTISQHRTEQHGDVESVIAGQWLYYVGIVAIIFAVAFFLKFAFDNNWIGPSGRVGIGLIAGTAMFPLSQWMLNRGYKYFSEGLAGLGAAILYLSIWAGWHYYMLFSQTAAFVLMVIVMMAIIAVSLGRDSERIAAIGLAGGLLTPILVSTGTNQETVLFSYLAVLGAGVLFLASRRSWASLPPVVFCATLIYFWGWYSTFYATDALVKTILFATAFFVIFAVLPAIRASRLGELPPWDIAIVVVNASNYLIVLRALFWPHDRWTLTASVLSLSAIHLLAERAIPHKQTPGNLHARILYAGFALLFATLAIPIRLDGHWITLAWALEGVLLIAAGLEIDSQILRAAGIVLFVIVGVRICALPIDASQTILWNARFLTMAFCSVMALGAFLAARRSKVNLDPLESQIYFFLGIAANLCFLAALSREVWDFYGRNPSFTVDTSFAQELALSVLWIIYALALLIPGAIKKSPFLRWQGLALLCITILKVFFVDLSSLTRFYRIVSFFVLGMVLLVVSFYYQKQLAAKAAKK